MITITPQMRILVAIEPVDGRKGIDSLAQLCREKLNDDPFSGCLFIFRNRRGSAIKLLVYDGQGFWLAEKRLLCRARHNRRYAEHGIMPSGAPQSCRTRDLTAP